MSRFGGVSHTFCFAARRIRAENRVGGGGGRDDVAGRRVGGSIEKKIICEK